MEKARIAQRKGFYFEVKAGQRYFWCACGRSANQPFCDGSHAGTGFAPVLFEATQDEDVIFCGCKRTGTRPFCDGAHNDLPDDLPTEDPDLAVNKAIRSVAHRAGALRPLDGDCYVFSTARAERIHHGTMAYCSVISPMRGALYQSQFYAEIAMGASPVMDAHGRHTVLFVTEGRGEVEISGRRFGFAPCSGLYVRPTEAFRVHNAHSEKVKLFISSRPGSDELFWREDMPANFDETAPNRLARMDPARRRAMADRYFQILVNREHGSTMLTQFTGHIPLSKAAPHRHLYEEAVIFLNGTGAVWTETKKTAVGPGDVLFLPPKQSHSVQCTATNGLDVVGVICPGDNPSISY